jgi:DNA-binding transcriptional regulator Cro
MRRKVVIDHFGGSQAEVARVLGIRPVCISKWRDVIPESCATRLHIITNAKLAYDPAVYDRMKKRKPTPYSGPLKATRQRRRTNGQKHAA